MDKDKQLKQLFELLKIKSISTNPRYKPEMKRAISYLQKLLKSMDFKTKILKGLVNDALFAQKIVDPKFPTVLFYGHYDVQPPEPLDKWISQPFNPEIRKGYLFARGADDDKGQLMIHLMAIQKLSKEGTLPVNIKFILEGEEELGSNSVPMFAKKYAKNILKCDYLVVSDSEMISKGNPSLDISLRGIIYTEVSLETAKQDLHSGSFGGVVQNPANALSVMISKLKDENGKVKIPGFYDNVLAKEKLPSTKGIKITKEKILKDAKVFGIGGGEKKLGLKERMWFRPTLDVNGIKSGFIEEGQKTIIPSKALAKISMRLVPNQDPNKIYELFEKYIKKITPKNCKLKIIKYAGSNPYLAPTNNPIYKIMKQSLKEVFKKDPVFIGVGGSIGFVPIMAKTLDVPCILVGFGLPTGNLHAPNENLYLKNYFGGIETIYRFLKKLGKNE